jgi:hypothetical protein
MTGLRLQHTMCLCVHHSLCSSTALTNRILT